MNCIKCSFFNQNKKLCSIDMVEANEQGKNCKAFKQIIDPVNHPSHYTSGKVECIDCIESAMPYEQFIGFLRGNVIKYVFRAGKKDSDIQDLKKAKWYLEKLIQTIENERRKGKQTR